MTKIGQRLSDEAQRRGISHETAGEMIGVSQATFSRWCMGANVPAARYWTPIGRFLKIRREEVGTLVAQARTARSPRLSAERLDDLEAQVGELRRVMLRIAERLGVEP
jgi:predicted site-specific integrase-resolvase